MYKKIVISIFIFFLLVSVIPFNNIAQAYIIDKTYDFESGTITHQFNSTDGTLKTEHNPLYDAMNVSSITTHSGIRDIRFVNIGNNLLYGWFNYTYNPNQFIHLWEIYIRGSASGGVLLFFNNSQKQNIIKLKFDVVANTPHFTFYDTANVQHDVYDVTLGVGKTTINTYYRFGFVMMANDTVNYYGNNTVLPSQEPRHVYDDCNITTISFVDIDYGAADIVIMDDNRIVISDTISGGGIATPTLPTCAASQVGQIMSSDGYVSMPPWYVYVSHVYCVVSTFNISNFYIMAENIYALSYYQSIELKINSYALGYPTNIDNRGSTLIISWENMSGVRIEGEMVYIIFKFPRETTHPYSPDPTKPYYFQTIPLFNRVTSDIDDDGFINSVVHADDNYWNNFCNYHNYRDLSINAWHDSYGHVYSPITTTDLDYSFCYEYPETITINPYQNDLWVTPLSVTVPNKVTVGYTLSSSGFLYNNFIRINKSGVDYYNESTPITVQGGSFDFRILNSGTYNVSLFQNHIKIKTVQFTATGSLNNAYPWIYTDLATVQAGQQFNIYYNYPYGNFQGALRYSKCGLTESLITTINKTSTGIVSYSITEEGLYTISLNVNPSTNSYSQLNTTTILVTNPHTNKIELSDSVIRIPKTITIFGEHAYTGSLVYIYKNGLYFQYVGCEPIFSIYDYITTSGNFTYSLIVSENGILKTLGSVRITCSGTPSNQPQQEDFITAFINSLPLVVKIILGLLLTLFITLLPLIIGVLLANHQIDMPNMVYVAFFFLGLGVSCGIGLLNWALFFVILLGLIVYYVVQSQQNKG